MRRELSPSGHVVLKSKQCAAPFSRYPNILPRGVGLLHSGISWVREIPWGANVSEDKVDNVLQGSNSPPEFQMLGLAIG